MNKGFTLSLILSLIFLFFLILNPLHNGIHKYLNFKPKVSAQSVPQPVIIADNLNSLFLASTNNQYPLSQDEFGAHTVVPAGNILYLGLSAGCPANQDGALLAKYENSAVVPITNGDPILEQGMHDMTFVDGVLYIAGTDPMEDWTSGNIYTYASSGAIIKHRNLPNVLHTWGTWVDSNHIYASVSSHTGDNQTWLGQIFKGNVNDFNTPNITDPDIIWPPQDRVTASNYRMTDIIGFNNKLYAISFSADGFTKLKYSTDEGITWIDFNNLYPDRFPRLIQYQDKLAGVAHINNVQYSSDSNALFTVDRNNNVAIYPLPANTYINTLPPGSNGFDYRKDGVVFNPYAVDDKGYLYLITKNQALIRTNDLTNWYLVSQFSSFLTAITYWPNQNSIIVTDRGPNAKIWKIDLSDINNLPPYIPPPTSTPLPTLIPPSPTSSPTPTPTPTMSISKEGKIEYGSANDFYLVNPDGTNNITFLSRNELVPPYNYFDNASLSIDGKFLSFVAGRNNNSPYMGDWNFKIITKSLVDGSFEEWLPEQPRGAIIDNPHLSPDNNEIYFSMVKPYADQIADTGHYSGISGIFKVRRGDNQLIKIIDYPPVWTKYILADISPDGNKLLLEYFTDASILDYFDIFISNADGTNRINLTNSMYVTKKNSPSLSNDGKKVIYHEINPDNSTYDLKVIDLETKTQSFINPTADYDEKYSCYSPDSSQIIYHSRSVQSPYSLSFLYRANADGTNPVKILDAVYSAVPQMHCWAPDPNFIETSPIPTPSCTLAKQGDINCSGKVNALDLSILLGKFGSSDSASDLNSSGKVNALDMSILLSNFGRSQ